MELAKEVLRLGEEEDWCGILNLAAKPGESLAAGTPTATLRKAYLKLSILIHPDKLSRSFPQATKAFQCLVKVL